MRNTIIVTILLFIAVIAASIYYFSDLDKDHNEAVKPLKFLPRDTYLIASFKNDETTDNIFKDFEIFNAILGNKEVDELTNLKNSLLRSPALQPYTLNQEIYISFHPEDNEITSLFTIPFTQNIPQKELSVLVNSLSNRYKVSLKDTLGTTLYTLDEGRKDTLLYAAFSHQMIFSSYSKNLLLKTLDDNNLKLSKDQIDYFIQHNSKNSPLSVYFDHKQIPHITKQLIHRKPGQNISLFADLRGQSAWNINYKNDALMLVGESEVTNDSSYLSIFTNQSKTDQNLYTYFPSNTASYLEYSISDTTSFNKKLDSFFDKNDDRKRYMNHIQNVESSIKIDYEKNRRRIWGDNFATVELTNGDLLGFVKIGDPKTFNTLISKLSKEIADSLYQLDFSNTLYFAYGKAFQSFQRPYFHILNDQTVVFANSQGNLQAYLRDWKMQNLLTGTLGFKNFEKLQGNKANVTFFLHGKNANSIIANSLTSSYLKKYRDKENFGFQDFYSWSIQLAGNNGSFLSSIYGIYKSKSAPGGAPSWTYPFDGKLIGSPWVFEHSDTSMMILAQEQNHTVHGIHPNGSKLWSAVFSGRVIGTPFQLADRSIVLVTDNQRLYRFDTAGKVFKNFSLGLPQPASYSPTLASYDNHILFIPIANKILAYDIEGHKVEQWKITELDGEILFDVKTIRFKDRDYIVVGTQAGSFYFLDTTGNIIKKVQHDDISKLTNPIFLTPSLDGPDLQIHTADGVGNLIIASLTGKTQKRPISQWSSSAYTDFRNVTSDDQADLVVVDKNKLTVHSIKDSTLYFQYTFTKDIDDRPQFFPLEKNLFRLGVASRSNYLIGLFNENGHMLEGFPLEALPNFYFGKINYAGGNYLLCTKRDHKLYAFPF